LLVTMGLHPPAHLRVHRHVGMGGRGVGVHLKWTRPRRRHEAEADHDAYGKQDRKKATRHAEGIA
jgi:hypothetical protein